MTTKIININEPVVWEQYNNIKILDIHPDQFEFVKNFVLVHMTSRHLLYLNEKITGALANASIEDLLNIFQIILQDRTSLIAIDENTNEIIGTIMLKVMDTDFHAWASIVKIPQTKNLQAIFNVTHFMLNSYNETKLVKSSQCRYSLHTFFCVTSYDYCGLKLKTKLLLAAGRVAASMRIPYLTTVFFGLNNQRRAVRAGMIEAYRIYYALYKDQNGNRPFDIKLKREWYCIFYIKPIEPQIPYTEL